MTVSLCSNCTAIELGNGGRIAIRRAKLHQADNVMEKNRQLGSKAVIPSDRNGEEGQKLTAGATGTPDATSTMPQL